MIQRHINGCDILFRVYWQLTLADEQVLFYEGEICDENNYYGFKASRKFIDTLYGLDVYQYTFHEGNTISNHFKDAIQIVIDEFQNQLETL